MMVGNISIESARCMYNGAIEALERRWPSKFFPVCSAQVAVDLGANMLMCHVEHDVTVFWDGNKKAWVYERPAWAQPN